MNDYSDYLVKSEACPSQDEWIREAKADPSAENIGMYLTHTGIVRKTAKALVRQSGDGTGSGALVRQSEDSTGSGVLVRQDIDRTCSGTLVRQSEGGTKPVTGMLFSYDEERVDAAINEALKLPGIYYLRVWLADGELALGDTIMQVLIGGDIRPHVISGLEYLVGRIKNDCVSEMELYDSPL